MAKGQMRSNKEAKKPKKDKVKTAGPSANPASLMKQGSAAAPGGKKK